MPPRPPKLRVSMQQQYQRAGTHLGDMEAGTVGIHKTMTPRPITESHGVIEHGGYYASAG